MRNFKFPPPPPPPPKASSNDAQHTYNSQAGGSHGRRGDRGRGRGVGGRGRANHFQGSSRGGFGQGDRTGNAHSRGGSRGGHQHSERGWQNQNTGHGPPQQQYRQAPPKPTPLPDAAGSAANAYGNPLLGVQPPQPDPTALAQAMTFMSTPAGMQPMVAFANHMIGANTNPQYSQSPPPQQSSPQSQSHQSPPSDSLKKRKRDERAVQWKAQQKSPPAQNVQQRGQKPPRAKATAPPPVPSFGFSLPPAPTPQPPPTSKPGGKNDQKKRKVDLGLTQLKYEDSESSSDEEVDEEVAFALNVKVEGIVFEHDGEHISLQSPAEIAAWIKDRRRQFPTKKRIAEKAQEAVAKRASELEFLRKVKGKPKKRKPEDQQISTPKPQVKEEQKSSPHVQEDLEKLHKRVQESMKLKNNTSVKAENTQSTTASAKPPAVDLGLGYESDTESDDDDISVLSDSSAVSSSEESSDASDSDSDSDIEPPEASSSHVAPTPIIVPPPPPTKPAPEPKKEKIGVCPQWKQTGRCKYGNHCRYPHPPKEEPKRLGLYERMVEQELEKSDRLALDAIKYLGRHRFLG